MNIITSTRKLERKNRTYDCRTSDGSFSIYLPLPYERGYITIKKTTRDPNQITIYGVYRYEEDAIVMGYGSILFTCNGKWWNYN